MAQLMQWLLPGRDPYEMRSELPLSVAEQRLTDALKYWSDLSRPLPQFLGRAHDHKVEVRLQRAVTQSLLVPRFLGALHPTVNGTGTILRGEFRLHRLGYALLISLVGGCAAVLVTGCVLIIFAASKGRSLGGGTWLVIAAIGSLVLALPYLAVARAFARRDKERVVAFLNETLRAPSSGTPFRGQRVNE